MGAWQAAEIVDTDVTDDAEEDVEESIVLGQEKGVPSNVYGDPAVEVKSVPVDIVEGMMLELRRTVLSEIEKNAAAREHHVSRVFRKRKKDLVEELEERLRLHWLRKGRVGVQYFDPRVAELKAHKIKTARRKRK